LMGNCICIAAVAMLFKMAYGDTSYFNDTIYINSTGEWRTNYANGTYGAAQLGDSACLITGSSGITSGTIQFKNMVVSRPLHPIQLRRVAQCFLMCTSNNSF
ncbi:MAG: hypothetical protein IPK10_18525, partial [Bacteroidetes bacterium]|nr:hypothetical protein [Bacteroidota bacterium]